GLARLGGLSLVAGIAAVQALHGLGFDAVRLKWPNDLVVLDRAGLRKLGGLLIEGGGEYAGPARAVIGLGLNVRMPAAAATQIDQPWCDLASLAGPRALSRNAVAAALRETEEEIGVPAALIAPLGFLDPLVTITGFRVLPLVAVIDPAYVARPDPAEVAEVFEVPLTFLLDPDNLSTRTLEYKGRARHVLEYRYP
ncbi:NUDIX domain-containing protein, partial [Lysobacter sp. 2RAB21]